MLPFEFNSNNNNNNNNNSNNNNKLHDLWNPEVISNHPYPQSNQPNFSY